MAALPTGLETAQTLVGFSCTVLNIVQCRSASPVTKGGERLQIALGIVLELQGEVGLNEPFTAFHNGSETEVSLDEVKLVRFMAVDNYKTWAYCAYYPRMVHLGSIWDIQVNMPRSPIISPVALTSMAH